MLNTLFVMLFVAIPTIPDHYRRCLDARRDVIVSAMRHSEASGVPAGVTLAIGFLESHNGCDPRGDSWGVAHDPLHWRIEDHAHRAISALASNRRACLAMRPARRPVSEWMCAISRFRCGRRVCPPSVGYSPLAAIALITRLYDLASLPRPEGL